MTDIAFKAGNTHVIRVTVLDLETVQPLDLTGAIIKLKVAKSAKEATPLIEHLVGDGIEVIDATGGVLEATLIPDDTEGLSGKYYYEIDVKETSGRILTVASGIITLTGTLIREADVA